MNQNDIRRYAILYVDDEERSLKTFERAFGHQFRIYTASTASAGLQLLEQHADDIGVVMTDQRMPGEKGVWLLDKARQLRPGILRVLVTAYTDLQAVIEAVNTGAIYQYVTKPWDPAQLENTLRHALQLFAVQRERDKLLREKFAVLHNMMISDRVVSLGFMAAGLSHHIRNSLVAVKTFIDLVPQQLREEGVEPAQSRNPEFWLEYQVTAQSYVERIDSLLKELWAIAETPSVAFTDQVDFRQAASATVHRLREPLAAKSISVEIVVPDSFPVLTVDKAKFERMLELLIKDEIVSLPDRSQITIAGGITPAKPEQVCISVRDNGPGLSQEILQTLFDPFSSRSDSPSEHGINLMACYFIAHYHGGRIAARSRPGEGTEFVIELPLTPHRSPIAKEGDLVDRIRRTDELWQQLVGVR